MTRTIGKALAVAALTAFATGALAQASANLHASRSNVYKFINPSDKAAVDACTKGGGTVGKDPQGKDACITQAAAPKTKP